MTPKLLALLAFALIALMIVRSLTARDKSEHSKINLEHLLLDEKGRTDPGRVILMGGFAFSTWMMIYLVMRESMSEGYFGLYLTAWVSPVVFKIIFGRSDYMQSPLPQPTTTVTTTTETAVQPQPAAARTEGGEKEK